LLNKLYEVFVCVRVAGNCSNVARE